LFVAFMSATDLTSRLDFLEAAGQQSSLRRQQFASGHFGASRIRPHETPTPWLARTALPRFTALRYGRDAEKADLNVIEMVGNVLTAMFPDPEDRFALVIQVTIVGLHADEIVGQDSKGGVVSFWGSADPTRSRRAVARCTGIRVEEACRRRHDDRPEHQPQQAEHVQPTQQADEHEQAV